MENILLPKETFNLYKAGVRTFIHVLRDNESIRLKGVLTYGRPVLLVNEDNGEKMEQTFWFAFDLRENDQFLIFVFEWEVKSILSHLRKQRAIVLNKDYGVVAPAKSFAFLSNTQKQIQNMLAASSALFFVSIDDYVGGEGDMFCFKYEDGRHSPYFIIIDILKLEMQNERMFKVYSLFPFNLL